MVVLCGKGHLGAGYFYFGQFVRRGWVVGGVPYGYFRELLTLLGFFIIIFHMRASYIA